MKRIPCDELISPCRYCGALPDVFAEVAEDGALKEVQIRCSCGARSIDGVNEGIDFVEAAEAVGMIVSLWNEVNG